MGVQLCTWQEGPDNSILIFKLRYLAVCPENEMNHSYEFCSSSQFGMLLGK